MVEKLAHLDWALSPGPLVLEGGVGRFAGVVCKEDFYWIGSFGIPWGAGKKSSGMMVKSSEGARLGTASTDSWDRMDTLRTGIPRISGGAAVGPEET